MTDCSDYIDVRLTSKMMRRFTDSTTKVLVHNHDDYVRVHSSMMYTNVVKSFFTRAFVNRFLVRFFFQKRKPISKGFCFQIWM